jgi:uncharacterized RDD family membrane protein YckC/predicted RNA-binding Zn-ribbon protein involved in translation (DUF1610 family)
MMAKLIINPTSASRREIQLPRSTLSIGRDPANDLVLPDAMVSRRHAVIECRGDQFFLRDCNSSNGSLVNGDRVSECSLKDGDLMAIGTSRLLFRDEPDDACQAEHRVGDQFCRQCGAQIAPKVAVNAVCPSCGTVVALPAKFCHVCGASFPRPADGLETTKPQPVLAEDNAVAVEKPAAAPPHPVTPPLRVEPPSAAPRSAPAAPAPPAVAPGSRTVLPPPPASLRVSRPAPVLVPADRVRPIARAPRSLAPASAFLRLIAALIDSAIVAIGEGLLLLPVGYYWWSRELPRTPADVPFLPILLSLTLVGLALLLAALYHVYFWGVQGATPGKHVLGLTIVDAEGRGPIGVAAAVLRLLGYVVSGLVLGIGFLLVPLTGRGLHDRIAGTMVVLRERV